MTDDGTARPAPSTRKAPCGSKGLFVSGNYALTTPSLLSRGQPADLVSGEDQTQALRLEFLWSWPGHISIVLLP